MKKKSPKKTSLRKPLPKEASHTLKAKLVRIGNSKGIRLPKAVIEQAGLGDEVSLIVGDRELILKSTAAPRAGWHEAMAKAIAEHGSQITPEDREWLDAPIDAQLDD